MLLFVQNAIVRPWMNGKPAQCVAKPKPNTLAWNNAHERAAGQLGAERTQVFNEYEPIYGCYTGGGTDTRNATAAYSDGLRNAFRGGD